MNSIHIYNLCILFVLHFISDFLLQSRETAKNKSIQFSYLAGHCWTIFFVTLFGTILLTSLNGIQSIALCVLNALIHGMIDWNIWKGYKLYLAKKLGPTRDEIKNPLLRKEITIDRMKRFAYWEDHWFYATIGLDQLLHALTILGAYLCVVKLLV